METLLKQIESAEEEMLSLLESWVNINSYTDNLEGLALMTDALISAFSPLQGEMQRIILPPRKKIDSKGNLYEAPVGNALVITKHPHAPIKVILGGHMDTVYPPDSPFQHFNKIDSDRCQGPGVADMKGGLVVLLKALETLEKSPFAGKIGWEVIINPDEEIGSPCSEALFIEAAQRNRFGLIFEPSFPDGSLVNERKGSLNFTVAARGKSAHAGRDFFQGRNAVIALARFILGVNALTNRYSGITVNVGYVQGGGPVNIVPDFAMCRINIRVMNLKDVVRIKESIQEMTNGSTEPDVEMTLYEDSARAPKPFDNKNQKLFETFKECAASLGVSIKWQASGGVCDGNILSAAGLATIDTLGVVGGCIHTPDEYCLINSLVERAKLTAYFLMKLVQV